MASRAEGSYDDSLCRERVEECHERKGKDKVKLTKASTKSLW
jgi:hypothetical protein